MKRILVLVLVVCIVFSLAALLSGCAKKGECDECGAYGKLHTYKMLGETFYLCDDCYSSYKELTSMFD
jgi:hypothetical protein